MAYKYTTPRVTASPEGHSITSTGVNTGRQGTPVADKVVGNQTRQARIYRRYSRDLRTFEAKKLVLPENRACHMTDDR